MAIVRAAPQIVRSGETSLEGLTRELMKPMLKEWLDKAGPEGKALVDSATARRLFTLICVLHIKGH